MSGAVELRFLRDGAQTVEQTADALCGFLRSARRELALATYDFHFEPGGPGDAVGQTLRELAASGISVRIVDHDDRDGHPPDNVPRPPLPLEYVDSLGLDVHPVRGFGTLMHHKYVVADATRVWTGSLNWTDDAFTRQENSVLVVECAELAAEYLRDFEQLRARSKPDGTGAFDGAWHELGADGGPIRLRAFFCPGRGPELAAAIGARIRTARTRISFCTPVLTSGPILGALADVVGIGKVAVHGAVDGTQMADVLRQWGSLPRAAWKPTAFRFVASQARLGQKRSTPYAPGRVHDYMHAKFFVCDDTVFAGSYNHSRSGEENAENVLQIESAAIADRFAAFADEVAAAYPAGPGSPVAIE